ncbi:hypothetical protein SDC9_177430 [bioreactor metagenome]|uniref:Uncharacterized protein n=1 Tax=bioreactor metagenome TaxID=1076179 RepID=A0A645H2A1_9ZZZZ
MRVVFSMTRLPAKPTNAPGSQRIISLCMAKLAVTPPVVGFVKTEMNRFSADPCLSTAPLTFAICIKDNMPSCIRAPPDAQKPTTGSDFSVAYSNRRVSFSPTALPILPIINFASIMKTAAERPVIDALPHITASVSPESLRAFAILLLYPGKVRGFPLDISVKSSLKLARSVTSLSRLRALI